VSDSPRPGRVENRFSFFAASEITGIGAIDDDLSTTCLISE
jgi:hypothetical protein